MKLVEVALKVPLNRTFDYLVDESHRSKLAIGKRVRVPFGKRELVGVVLTIKEDTNLAVDKLKSIYEVIDEQPILTTTYLKFLQFCSRYYCFPLGETLFTALPAALRNGDAIDKLATQMLKPSEQGSAKVRGKKQQALLDYLIENRACSIGEIKALGFTQAQIKSLEDKSLVERFIAPPTTWQSDVIQINHKPVLNAEQATACAAIKQVEAFSCFLLEGITGSGKTEVYLQALEDIVKQGLQALVLVPEIGLTPQTVNRFRKRFANLPIALWHSNLSDNERLEVWRQVETNECAIVIGTRSSIFLPFAKLGMLIVDEEHDASFKQQDGLRYHARDLAAYRAATLQIPMILGSATPALESLQHAISNKYRLLTLSQRAQTATANQFHLVDMKGQIAQQGFAGITLQTIQDTLARGKQVMVFLNRRGFAPTLICHECGWLSNCHRCSSNATYHKGIAQLICHHCGDVNTIPRQCPDCGSTQIMPTGLGTEQVAEFLNAHLPNTPITRIDRDTTRKKGSFEEALDEIRSGGARVLVGTQMLAKGHHFPDVALVVILDVDSGLYSSDFRATEHMAQLITQVAGRAGRSGEPGKVLLQTHFPEHPLLQDLVNNGYQDFARYALTERQEVGLPPFSHLALIRAEGHKFEQVLQFLSDLVPKQRLAGIQLLGPLPAPLERIAGKFRYQLHIQAESRNVLHHYLAQLSDYINSHPLANRIRWSIDVDPIDMY
ncbi:primosomal protein N' [Pseudoalteromonas xiamenensis]|uniref:Replication restart protein PriA n=1 Tax=Pseudoalteromonas xiamenensis TaxID=882626 RepID=A0A975HK29_9GAMM|nr:primosomal protein N' [Pseudoalteromonas xiamenensis]QTH70539.1 primosomal protein N' [Pseudoalteromonas xiamenensis]